VSAAPRIATSRIAAARIAPSGARLATARAAAGGDAVGKLVLAALLSAATDLSGLGLLATATWLISRAAQRPPIVALTVAIVAVRGLAIAKGTLRYLERLAGHDAALRVLARLRTRIYARLSRDTGRLPRGDLLARLVSDVDSVQDLLLRCAIPAAVAAVVTLVTVGFVAAFSGPAALLVAAGLVLAGLALPAVAFAAAARASARIAQARGRYLAASVDVLAGAADLAVFGATGAALSGAARHAGALARLERRAGAVGAVTGAVGALVPGATAIGVFAVTVRGGPSVMVAVLSLVALASVEAVLPLIGSAVRYAELRGAWQRIRPLLAEDSPGTSGDVAGAPGVPDASPGTERASGAPDVVGRSARAADTPDAVERSARAAGAVGRSAGAAGAADAVERSARAADAPVPAIAARRVSVRYPGAAVPALDGVDLDLSPGRRVAVVGPSGAGKSTLLGLLVGQLRPAGGALLVDGVPAHRTDRPLGWPCSGGVLADGYVFHASVRENLTLGRTGFDDAALSGALAGAGLGDWAERLDEPIGEDGATLSGGQRQRLLLARALVDPPPVLVLDEPTEGLDPAAADEVLAGVLRGTAGHTVVLVTHRLVDLRAFDEIVVLVDGRVAARGTHDALLARPGWYSTWAAIREVPESTIGAGVGR
jgi:ATP-binding cassette subfamily C protein CydC